MLVEILMFKLILFSIESWIHVTTTAFVENYIITLVSSYSQQMTSS